MDYENIVRNKDIIIDNLNKITVNLSKINSKISYINKIYEKLEKNTLLKFSNLNNSNLLFQCRVLRNEYSYYKNHYQLILNNFCDSLFKLNENIKYILLSLNDLEIDSILKKSIFNKISYQKKSNNINYSYCNGLINNIVNNLKVLDELIKLLNDYVLKVQKVYKKKNIHNDNFKLSIKQKHQDILNKYLVYCNKFELCVDYYKKYTNSVIQQIDDSKILILFLN